MFVHNLSPVLLDLGFFQIRYYSLAYLIGFLLAYWMLYKIAEKKAIKNLTKKAVDDLITYLILGVIIGGRLGHFIFYNPSIFWTDPLEIFFIWHGGMAFHGGLIGVIIAYLLFSKKHKINFYELADVIVIPVSIALFLGRIANFINAELWGTRTNVSWCVEFPDVEGCRHPSQIYEAFKNLFIFGVLMFQRRMALKKGVMFWTFITLYGLLRFLTNFYREDPALFLEISMGQTLSLVMFVAGLVMLAKINKWVKL